MGPVEIAASTVAANPILTAIVVTLLVLVFGGYLFLRRILVNARRGYHEGRNP